MAEFRLDSQSSSVGGTAPQNTTTGGYKAKDTRVQFERFDSSSDDRREEKLVFKYIQRIEVGELTRHLIETESKFNITEIYDRSGYSPLHFSAYKNSDKIAEVLCHFVSQCL